MKSGGGAGHGGGGPSKYSALSFVVPQYQYDWHQSKKATQSGKESAYITHPTFFCMPSAAIALVVREACGLTSVLL